MTPFVPVHAPNIAAPDPCRHCSRSDTGCESLRMLSGRSCCADCTGPADHPPGTLPNTKE